MNCRVCDGNTRELFRQRVLGKYDVRYFQCSNCGMVQTEKPYWLDEAYASPIAVRDTGILWRNQQLATVAASLFWKLFRGRGRFLDAAGGYGIFTRLMRDIGFDYYWWDPHSQNLLARGFEGSPEAGPYQAITAFEVLEHLDDPVRFLRDIIERTGCRTLLTSTEVFRGHAPDPASWWYYTFDTGQHISFYNRSALEVIARKLGLRLYARRNLQLWTDQPLTFLQFRIRTDFNMSRLLAMAPRRRLRSRVQSDSEQLADFTT